MSPKGNESLNTRNQDELSSRRRESQFASDVDATSQVSGTFVPDSLSTVYQVDVTNDLTAWLNGTPNYGWVLLGDPVNDDLARFYSSDLATVENRPRLVVQYAAVPEPGTWFALAGSICFTLIRRRRV